MKKILYRRKYNKRHLLIGANAFFVKKKSDYVKNG